MAIESSYGASLFLGVAGALFSLWSLYFLGKTFGQSSPLLRVSGGDYFSYALVGVSLSFPLRASMASVTGRVRDLQYTGAFEPLVAAPVSPFGSVLLLALYPLVAAVIRGLLLLALGIVFFGARFPNAAILGAVAALALGLVAYLGLGILSAAIVILLKRSDPVAWAVNGLTFIASGIFYPVEVLPKILHPVAELLPATHALAAIRLALFQGVGVVGLRAQLGKLAVCSLVILPICAIALRIALRRAAREGSLGQA